MKNKLKAQHRAKVFLIRLPGAVIHSCIFMGAIGSILILARANGTSLPKVFWIQSALLLAASGIISWLMTTLQGTHFLLERSQISQDEDQRKLRRLFESNIIGIITYSADGRITAANDAFLQMVGYSREDLNQGLIDWVRMTPPEWMDLDKIAWEQLESTGVMAPIEKEYYRKDGSRIRVRVQGANFQGSRIEGIAYILDVTEQWKAQLDLEMQSSLTRTVTESATSCLFMMDQRGFATFMNPAAERVTGFQLEEMKEKPLHYYVHHHRPDGRFYPMEECPLGVTYSEQVSVQNQEETFVRKDGTFFPVQFSVVPIFSGTEMTGAILEFRDITEQKRAEQKLVQARTEIAQERYKLEQIFKHSPAAMALWVGERLIFEKVNPQYQALFTDRELIGRPFLEAVPELQEQKFDQLLSQVLKTGKPFIGYEILTRHKRSAEGELEDRYYDSAFVRVQDSEGNPYGVYNHAVDVTERVLARRRIEESEQRLKDALRARDEFLSIASHELKTPISSLKLQAQLAKRQRERGDPNVYGPQRVNRLIDQTERQVERIARLVDDMLDISRIRSGKLTIRKEPLDLTKVVGDVIERLRPHFTEAGISVSFDSDGSVEGQWDRIRLEQVVTNLLTNAMRYGNKKPVSVSLGRMTPEVPSVRLSVQDQGMGIHPDARERIFNRFERAVDPNEITGLGLGLFITRQIVEAHGGKIWAESSGLGQGATFIIELLAAQAD